MTWGRVDSFATRIRYRRTIAAFFASALLVLSQPGVARADTPIVQQLYSDATTTIGNYHWGTRFVATSSATVKSIAVGESAVCGSSAAIGHMESFGMVIDRSFPLAGTISGGFRFAGSTLTLQAGVTYFLLLGTNPFPCPAIDMPVAYSQDVPLNTQIFQINAAGYWNPLTVNNFGIAVKDIVYRVCSDSDCTLTPPQAACTPGVDPECNDNVLFIPGIEASRLYRPDYNGGTEKLWEPSADSDAADLALDETGTSIRNDIYTKDLVDEAYGTLNIYKSFLADLSVWKNQDGLFADYSAVPYDWRLSLADVLKYGHNIDGRLYYSGDLRATSTPYIIQELRRLAASSRTGKVTIIAHSNGGLVAKALIKQLEDTHDPLADVIGSLILVAVPQAGTPVAIGGLLHGFGQGIPLDWLPLVLSPGAARDFAHESPMAYHLLPSSGYFSGQGSQVATPVVHFNQGTATQAFVSVYGTTITDATELSAFLQGSEERTRPEKSDVVDPSVLVPGLLSYGEEVHDVLDTWTPPPSMHVYQIAGWGIDTVSGITYDNNRVCTERVALRCTKYTDTLRYKPDLVVDGDGTVVVSSALAMSTSSPNVSRWWVNLDRYNSENIIQSGILGRNHANILEVPELRHFIQSTLSGSLTSNLVYVSSTAPSSASDARLVFLLHSPLSLSVTDNEGHEISSSTSSVSGGYFRRFGEVQYISVPASMHPVVHLTGVESGSFTLEVSQTNGDTVVASTTFEGIPSATTTSARMSFDDGTIAGASPLTVDVDGDGVVDVDLAPKEDGTLYYKSPKLPLMVRANNVVATLGETPALTATLSGFLPGDSASSSTSGVASCGVLTYSKVGTYTITCTSGSLASDTYAFTNFIDGLLTVRYRWDGFLQPINDTAHDSGQAASVFKAGSTVPVKFQLKNASGTPQEASSAPEWLNPVQGAAMLAAVDESIYSVTASGGGAYKWDATSGQYVYNWSTKGLKAGYWYKIFAKLNDGQIYSVVIGLK